MRSNDNYKEKVLLLFNTDTHWMDLWPKSHPEIQLWEP